MIEKLHDACLILPSIPKFLIQSDYLAPRSGAGGHFYATDDDAAIWLAVNSHRYAKLGNDGRRESNEEMYYMIASLA